MFEQIWGEWMVYLYAHLRTEAAQLAVRGWYEIPRHVTRESRFAHVLSYSCTQCGLGRVTGPRRLDALRQTLTAGVYDMRDINIALRHLDFQNYRSDHESDVGQLLLHFIEPDLTAVHAVSMYPFATGWLPSEHSPADVGNVWPRSANSAWMLQYGLPHVMSPHIFASGSTGCLGQRRQLIETTQVQEM